VGKVRRYERFLLRRRQRFLEQLLQQLVIDARVPFRALVQVQGEVAREPHLLADVGPRDAREVIEPVVRYRIVVFQPQILA
jgi:hypothetical protein